MNSGNAAGSNGSTAAVWSNAAPQGNVDQVFLWPQSGLPQYCPVYPPPTYPWHPGFHSMGMPQASSNGAGPSSLYSGAPSSTLVLSDSDTEINPSLMTRKEMSYLGTYYQEEDEDEQEGDDGNGSPPAKRAKLTPSARTINKDPKISNRKTYQEREKEEHRKQIPYPGM